MSDSTSSANQKNRANWTTALVTALVTLVHQNVVLEGIAAENGLKKQTWTAIRDAIKSHKDATFEITNDKLQNKLSDCGQTKP